MSAKPNDFKLGLFVLGGIAIVLACLFAFGASKLFESKTLEETYVMEGVEGLKAGAPVLLRGVPVGQVTRINFSWNIYHVLEPRCVVIEFEVGNKVAMVPPGPGYAQRVQEEVAKGLRARVKSEGLAGATVLSLEYLKTPAEQPPLKVPWKPHHIYIPSAPAQFSQIIASLDTIALNLKRIDFQKLGDLVQQDLAAVDRVVEHVDQLNVPALGTNLNALVADLRGVSIRLDAFVGQTNQLASANLEKLAHRADEILGRLQMTVGKLDSVVGNVDEASLNESLENVRQASHELEQALHRLEEYPAGVLFGRPPPPAKSVEPRK